MNIVVIGSFMMDLVVRTDHAPQAGQTLIGNSFGRFPGGKGANQAVAAARLGGCVTMIGCVGKDSFGAEFMEVMRKEGIQTNHISFDDTASTGVGSVVLEKNGENRIIVVPGANLKFTIEEVRRLESLISQADMLIMQLEMDFDMTREAIQIAHRYGTPTILNPAPARELSDELLGLVTYLTPNETELEILSGTPVKSIEDAKQAGQILVDKGVKHVIVTLASKGALIVDETGSTLVEGFPADPIDTVAAGDSFNGALAVRIAQGQTLIEAVRFANAVGSITVTREGAIPSLPYLHEVMDILS